MADDKPNRQEDTEPRWRVDLDDLVFGPRPGPFRFTRWDIYELPGCLSTDLSDDDLMKAHPALVECVRKAEVYDRIAEIVAQPLPAIRDGLTERGAVRSVRAIRYQLIASEFPEAD